MEAEGRAAEAKKAFEAFLADTPADAPWRAMLLAEMGAADSRPPALDDSAMADAANMSEADRTAMIRSMVDGLEQKLAADGADLAGWLRLIRARGVLGEADRARRSYDTARARFKDDPQALARLDGLAKEMDMR